jgi:hypothetical protein
VKSETRADSTRGHELSIHEIRGPVLGARLRRRHPRAPPHGSGQAHRPHQTTNGAPRHADTLAAQLLPHRARPIDLVVLVIDPLNREAEVVVALGPCRARGRIDLSRVVPVVRRRAIGSTAQIGSTPYWSR